MGGNEVMEADEPFESCLPSMTVAIAINGKRESKYVVKWALEQFVTEGKVVFKLLHVRSEITSVPTLMGNSIPISHVREDVAAAYKKEVEWQTNAMLLPYTKLCGQRKVDVVVIESDDVANAIAQEVAKYNITKLVIGASARGIFARKVNRNNMSSRISACSPNFCTVYAISKGKLSSVRPSDLKIDASIKDDSSETSCSANSSSSYTSSSQTEPFSVGSYSHFHSPSLPMQRFHALSAINQNLLHSRASSIDTNHSRNLSLDIEKTMDSTSLCVCSSDIEHAICGTSSYEGLLKDSQSHVSDQASTSDVHSEYSSSDTKLDMNFEIEKLRIELRHVRGMYAVAQRETLDASQKISNLNERRSEEAMKLKEITYKEEEARELARKEMERCEAAKMEADYVRECTEKEASQRQEVEMKALRDTKEREKLEKALVGPVHQYQKFEWEEIVSATSSFSESLRIGMGAYGTVYKCSLHQTTAAVKVLHSNENQNNKQFQQEIEILSKIRHPHLLILLGACPDHGCLIYEYMENGSLEDRLFRVNCTPSIPWFERYRIAWEVASALVFLHSSKPKPIIHRDLKPANILLDRNFVSKIGDVGLSMVLNSDAPYASTMFKDTAPVGTLCYIDPEYQRTGLISPKSDVYAFGMVILQLLTAKPAVALTHKVETAFDDGQLATILDSEAGNWPIEETKELALLGLNCAELRRRDRPDLKEKVLPVLERLKELADRARDSFSRIQPLTPNHFICPILKDVMNEPCVAADGYTYDRQAIEKWLTEDDKSPMTNLPMPNKVLLPNYTLLSAIMDWKSKN